MKEKHSAIKILLNADPTDHQLPFRRRALTASFRHIHSFSLFAGCWLLVAVNGHPWGMDDSMPTHSQHLVRPVTTEPDHHIARLRMLASLLRWHEGSIGAYLSSSSFVIGVLAWEGFDVTAKESGLDVR